MTRNTGYSILGVISLLFLFLTVNPLLFQSYWENEADYILHARLPLPLIHAYLAPDQSGFYFVLLHLWMRVFGDSEPATRSLSVLFGLGSLYVIYRLGSAFFQQRTAGVLAALFFGISSFIVEFSQETKHWTLFVFLTLSSLHFQHQWYKNGKIRNFIFFWLIGILNLQSCLYAVFVFPPQLLFLAVCQVLRGTQNTAEQDSRWGREILWFGIWLGIVFIAVKGIHLWSGYAYVRSRGPQWGLTAEFPGFFIALGRQLLFYGGPSKLPLLVNVGFVVAYFLFFLGLVRMRRRDALLVLVLFLLPLIVSFELAGSSAIRSRYFIHLIPLFWLSASGGILFLQKRWIRFVSISLIVILCLYSLYNYFTGHRKEDWKSSVAYLSTRLKPDDIVIIAPYWVKSGWQFYSSFRFVALSRPKLEEFTSFDRAWVVSLYGETPIPGNFTPFERKNFHAVSVKGYDLAEKRPKELEKGGRDFDFEKHLPAAKIWAVPFNGARVPFFYEGREAYYLGGEERGVHGEGLLFDSRSPRPFQKNWNVAARTVQRSGGILRHAIWAHPPQDGDLVIEYPKIRLGKSLSGFYGFTDMSTRPDGAPVRFQIMINEKPVFETLKGNAAGWKEFSVDTSALEGLESTVQFRVQASNNRWRHFCFDAYIP